MEHERVKNGFVGCGGNACLYADIYTDLAHVIQVEAVGDWVDELAENRLQVLIVEYRAGYGRGLSHSSSCFLSV